MKTNLQFLKDLIDSDFLLLNYSKEFNFKIKTIVGIKTQRTFSLDLLESNKNLKQFIRNLQYLTKSEIYSLQILIKNKYLESLFKECLLEENLKNQCYTAIMASKLKNAKKVRNMLLLLGNTSKDIPNSAFFEKNLLLVQEIHSEVSLENFDQLDH